MRTHRRIVLRAYPDGAPRNTDFEIQTIETPDLGDGEVEIATQFLSMDPAPRLRMDPAAGSQALRLDQTVIGRGAGIVRKSRHPAFQPGDCVLGEMGWQELAILPGDQLRKAHPLAAPLSSALGVLGPPGIAAWCLVNIAAPIARGSTVAVTAAAGAVGSVILQLARLAGARTIATVAGDAQRQFAAETLRADVTVVSNSASFESDLAAALGDGYIDIVFDSVGGEVHNALMDRIAEHARIVAFGYISRYNDGGKTPREYGRIYQLIHRRAQLNGFLVRDHAARFDDAIGDLARLHASGEVQGHERIIDGLENAPEAFSALFSAEPVGKQLVRLIPLR